MLTRWRVAALVAIGIVLASAQVGAHQNRVRLPLSSNTCRDGSPERIWVVNGADATDCSTGGSTFEVECCCIDGTWDQCPGGTSSGSSDSFKTQNTPSGTDPVADSSTDTLNWTAGTGITITGDSTTDTITIASTATAITLDLGDDGGNDSTALAEIAPINDNGGAFSEPSADKLQIDVAKLRPPSTDNPPETAPDWSCEFAGSICSGTLGAEGTTSTPVGATIDLTASVSGDPIYSTSFIQGSLCFQSDESAGQAFSVSWSNTAPTDATYLAKVTFQNRNLSQDPEGTFQLTLLNSGDANEGIYASYYAAASGWFPRVYVVNNGTTTTASGAALGESTGAPTTVWLAIWKISDVYHFGYATNPGGLTTVLGSVTKTGVTSFDTISLRFLTANETPSIVWCADYVRQWDSLVYAFVNP